ncbi:winged helix-turn-helix transcriptional regulator [Paenibacillus arenilitoris]|uniref:Winged helix-turn-helix transcriptional regulator n=1 Tax=Paenibacillus arenilitoris TaxID=2772299 RepID=A0A927CKI0_9BACL|nr:winged helix-turn-helix transcriptional regulator [Paenibacillus arenilitoris]MBD2868842.1 winged helix-turn-helix transcriptional regulator [Paenibacillus arenilitoris]
MSQEERVLRLSRELTGQWTLPILLALEGNGGRFTPLQNKLNIAPSRLSANLKKMVEDGLLLHLSPSERRHPLLPEYVLTEKGRLHREAARAVQLSEERIGHGRLSDKMWGMPILLTLNFNHTRFQEIRQLLDGITPRILSLRLQQFHDDGLVCKHISEEPRPSFLYQLEKQVQHPVQQLSIDLASLV